MTEISRRRSDRVSIILPVAVSGRDAAGQPVAEHATTVTVSQHGAAIALMAVLAPGQAITIRRQRTPIPREMECYVVGKTGMQAGRQIFSVAFREPAARFWDIYFPPLPPDQETAGRALLGCNVCGARKVVHLDPIQLSIYTPHRQLSLHCDKCGKVTIWLESQQATTQRPDVGPANPSRLAPAPPPPNKNQRKHRRVRVEIPVCIRQTGMDDDVGTTVDISRGGLLFTSSRHHCAGSFFQLAVPYSPTAVNVFVDARVVHSSKLPSQELYRHGIMYLAENE